MASESSKRETQQPEAPWQRGWPALATRRPVAVAMIAAASAVFGLVAYQRLSLSLLPELSYPTLTVRTDLPGAAPEEVEQLVTRPIEEGLSTLEGLVRLSSRSRAGRSDVSLEFRWGSRVDTLAQKVHERLALTPLTVDEAGKPLLLRFDPNLEPMLRLALRGDQPLDALREHAETELRPALERLPGVAMVQVRGGLERVLRVDLSEELLRLHGVDAGEVAARIAAENLNLPGGRLEEGNIEYLVRTVSELRDAAAVGAVVVRQLGSTPLRVRDLGKVEVAHKERELLSRLDGAECVELEVYREADAHMVDVSTALRERIWGAATIPAARRAGADSTPAPGAQPNRAQADTPDAGAPQPQSEPAATTPPAAEPKTAPPAGQRKGPEPLVQRLPPGMEVLLLSDSSDYIRGALTQLRSAAVVGGLFAVLLLFLFLRSLGATAVVAVAIPLSLVAAFVPMMLAGVSLNLMSLGGLALGVGMLVDNSIVVLESISRCREEGDSPGDAARRGAWEVGGAVVASTLTTVAVFFPIVFVEGVAGQLFGDLALAVVFSLLASLVVALFLVPMLAARGGGPAPARAEESPRGGPALSLLGDLRAMAQWLRSGGRARWLSLALLPAVAPYLLLRTSLQLGLLALRGGAAVALMALALVLRPLRRGGRSTAPLTAALGAGAEALGGTVAQAYAGVLATCLRRPSRALLPALLLLLGAAVAARGLGAELIPELHRGELLVDLRCAVGTELSETARRVLPLEQALAADPAVALVASTVGVETSEALDADQGEHTARLRVLLHPQADLAAMEDQLQRRILRLAGELPGVEALVRRPALFSLKPPIEIELRGQDLRSLARGNEQVLQALEAVPGLTELRSSHSVGYPELHVRFRREELARRSIELRQAADALAQKVRGSAATWIRRPARREEVRVQVAPDELDSLAALARLDVAPGPANVPLAAVADLVPALGPAEIRRIDGARAVVLSARPDSLDLAGTVARIDDRLRRVELPPDLSVGMAGQSEEMERSLGSLRWALLLAIFLVYIVMAATFESVAAPLVVLCAVPLAAVGMVAALRLSDTPLSVVTLLGAIVLVGVVVNNAIVLVDHAQRLRRAGIAPAAALLEAGRVRLRPIVVSTLTTVLGLLPMAVAVGQGAEIQRPMALTVIGGLSVSTLLTLLVVPAALRATLFRGEGPQGAARAGQRE